MAAPSAAAAAEADPGAAAAPVAPAAEVADFEGSLLEAVAEGHVQAPEGPLTFRGWIRWRAGAGRRHRAAPPVASSESGLWRSTMLALFGEDWRAGMADGYGPGAAA